MRLKTALFSFLIIWQSWTAKDVIFGKASLFSQEFLKLSQVKKGMKGYSLSVFQGLKPSRFTVEILGVLKNRGPDTHLILAKFSGGPLKKTGIIAGMSGSPVYIQGKLIGAISHAYPWAKEPIGAIQPIEQMLKLLEKGPEDRRSGAQNNRTSWKAINARGPENPLTEETMPALRQDFDSKAMQLLPIRTPVLFKGLDNRVLNVLNPKMSRHGMYPIQQSTASLMPSQASPLSTKKRWLNPGDAVGIVLISGDMQATSLGTVTYRRGNKVLMFGHPAFFKGPINLPMSREYIHAVVPSRFLSFKLSSTLWEVGRVFNDKLGGLAGELGIQAPMMPLNVRVTSQERPHQAKQKKSFRFQIVKDANLLPDLLITAILQSLTNISNQEQASTVALDFLMRVKNKRTGQVDTIQQQQLITGATTINNLFLGIHTTLFPMLEQILFNRFAKTEILSIQANMDLTAGWHYSQITNVQVLKQNIKPGDQVPILVTLESYQGSTFYKKSTISIPQNLKTPWVYLNVGNINQEILNSNNDFIPKNYEHLLEILNKNQRFNHLGVWLDIPDLGFFVAGKQYPSLPSSMLDVMQKTHIDQISIKKRIKKTYPLPYFIHGFKTTPIFVKLENRPDID